MIVLVLAAEGVAIVVLWMLQTVLMRKQRRLIADQAALIKQLTEQNTEMLERLIKAAQRGMPV